MPCGAVLDSDGDGVLDDKDRCPDTPKGVAVDAVGCPLDSDGDGVVDMHDQCPDTPKGAAVDTKGCQLDSDGDGVVDMKDQCPNTRRVHQLMQSVAPSIAMVTVSMTTWTSAPAHRRVPRLIATAACSRSCSTTCCSRPTRPS
ncbi:thrombospondin type 3 repeat-containing protein [Candidatus Reidiella endopervernicosa]|uniref:Thrombospondin type 3 repeat-containing protein n=1 Tax=Candidatus Reidiella endopervernicosa TaxID=2738883 RepID=A0A6N0I0F3_9GAMM|nr:thrombospondin type 3 repeat-containing protein [Candidatus Reidiella endopervernicosa]